MPPTIFVLTTAAAAGAVTAPLAAWALARADAPIPVWRAAALAAVGVAMVTARWQAGGRPGWWLPVPVVLTVIAVPLALADLRHLRLPDVLTLPAYPLLGAAIGAAALGGGGPSLAARAAAGALLFGGAHALVARAVPGSLGAGDVKLSGSLGAVLGATGWPALALAAILAALFSLAIAIAQEVGRRRPGTRAREAPSACLRPAQEPHPAPAARPTSATERPVPVLPPAPTAVRHPAPSAVRPPAFVLRSVSAAGRRLGLRLASSGAERPASVPRSGRHRGLRPAPSATTRPASVPLPAPSARPHPAPSATTRPASVPPLAPRARPHPAPAATTRPASVPPPAPPARPHPAPSTTTRPTPIPPPIRPFGGHRVPHGPALLAATWLCALFPGAP
ncbi:Uncharacterised protein [Amycolatopsis camponoti]|uniref:Prepilin type IV endopeptidase peptidase domain-containing protein n=1 Tax=Amycolatopsis camponoti TaxID=2606593 RepID=A0A6I8LN42_9PSEU|nr:A24 family peptidase [Amycolatopsis camponoti]VVJ17165.1 Uncharacterised protein [Amycolatopsis camponoti]